jgi:hypothetical protein
MCTRIFSLKAKKQDNCDAKKCLIIAKIGWNYGLIPTCSDNEKPIKVIRKLG